MSKINYAGLFRLDPERGLYYKNITVTDAAGRKKQKRFASKDPKELYRKIMAFEKGGRSLIAFPTVEKLLEDWLEQKETEVRPNTMECYALCCKHWTLLYSTKIDQLTAKVITRRLDEVHWAGYSGKVIKTMLSCLRMALDWAALHYPGLDNNPAGRATLPRRMKSTKREPPDEETTARIIAARDSYFGLFFYALIYTGMRRGELLGLQWDAVNFASNTISITQQVTYVKGKALIAPLKTESSYRVIPILPPLRDELMKIKPDDWAGVFVFHAPTDPHQPMPERTLRRKEMHFCKVNGFITIEITEKQKQNGAVYIYNGYHPTITPHMMRHCIATLCYETGVDAMTTAVLLGHSDIQITQSIYTSLREKHRADELTKHTAYIQENYTEKAH